MAVVVRAAGRFAGHCTLDVPERQCLLGLDPAQQGCSYEQHVLLVKLDGARWVALDCRGDIDV